MRIIIGKTPAPEDHSQEFRAMLENALAERDACFQELFESNRHAAFLARERQMLIDRINGEPLRHRVAELERSQADAQHYIHQLELLLYARETERLALAAEVASLQARLQDSCDKRAALLREFATNRGRAPETQKEYARRSPPKWPVIGSRAARSSATFKAGAGCNQALAGQLEYSPVDRRALTGYGPDIRRRRNLREQIADV